VPSGRDTLTDEARSKPGQEWFTPQNACFLGLIVLAVIIFIKPLVVVVGSSISLDQYSQMLVVPPISVALLYLEQKTIFAKVSFARLGAVFFVVFIAIFTLIVIFSRKLEPSLYISLSILLFAGCCIAAFWFVYGDKALCSGLFPLCFLVFMTPLPDGLRDRVIVFLQYGSAVVTDWFFSVTNIPFSRDGVVIMLPTVTIEIAQECSGIRSSVILVIAGLVLGHLFLRKIRSKIALVALLVPLTIAKNAFRIFSLSTLGMYVNQSFLSGRLHHQGGIVFFAVAFVALWVLVWILQKLEGQPGAAKTVPQT
jgi:exosortase